MPRLERAKLPTSPSLFGFMEVATQQAVPVQGTTGPNSSSWVGISLWSWLFVSSCDASLGETTHADEWLCAEYRLGVFGFLGGKTIHDGGVSNAGLCEYFVFGKAVNSRVRYSYKSPHIPSGSTIRPSMGSTTCFQVRW